MPWIALAYKSVIMYFVTTSAALRLGGPAYPASLPNGGVSRNGRGAGWGPPTLSLAPPHHVLLPHPGGAVRVPLLRGKPCGEYRLEVDQAQEVAGGFLVLRIT